jgi:hypothetical protein
MIILPFVPSYMSLAWPSPMMHLQVNGSTTLKTSVTNVESWCLESKVRLLLFDDSKLKRRGGLEGDLAFIYIRRRSSRTPGSNVSRRPSRAGRGWAISTVEVRAEVRELGRGSWAIWWAHEARGCGSGWGSGAIRNRNIKSAAGTVLYNDYCTTLADLRSRKEQVKYLKLDKDWQGYFKNSSI